MSTGFMECIKTVVCVAKYLNDKQRRRLFDGASRSEGEMTETAQWAQAASIYRIALIAAWLQRVA